MRDLSRYSLRLFGLKEQEVSAAYFLYGGGTSTNIKNPRESDSLGEKQYSLGL
jgi:hypothetical protein